MLAALGSGAAPVIRPDGRSPPECAPRGATAPVAARPQEAARSSCADDKLEEEAAMLSVNMLHPAGHHLIHPRAPSSVALLHYNASHRHATPPRRRTNRHASDVTGPDAFPTDASPPIGPPPPATPPPPDNTAEARRRAVVKEHDAAQGDALVYRAVSHATTPVPARRPGTESASPRPWLLEQPGDNDAMPWNSVLV